MKQALLRWRRAWRYACKRLSPDDAQDMMLQLRFIAGWEPLVTLCVEDVMDLMENAGVRHPRLRVFVEEAVIHVGRKFESSDALSAAQDWAVDMAYEYAYRDGVELPRMWEAA